MISFIAAVYNEEQEINDLLAHVSPFVDLMFIADDKSTDRTLEYLENWYNIDPKLGYTSAIEHIGLPETVKNEALQEVPSGSWVLMLDADERFITPLHTIVEWVKSPEAKEVDYVYFSQYEIIDGSHVRTFQKCKLFRKQSITFSTGIHEDDRFEGRGEFFGWEVAHRKTSYKQIQRETEYLQTYKALLDAGKIDEGRYNWLIGLHHYVKPHG